ncbi:MAG TPA: hypothetical protein DIS76_07420, partial [Rhodospirillaceae bacterium]|nr:hypothetical protein [Rhodospirillaceae bacterium]
KDRSREIIGKLLYQMAMNFDDQLPDEIQKWLRGEGVCYQNQELETLDAAHDPYLEYFNAELSKLTQHEKNGPLGEIKGLMRQAK